MQQRMNFEELEPNALTGMFELEKYLNSTSLEKKLRELIKIRSSQINSCAYCIEMHTTDALKNGEDQKRIFALSAWRESPLFTEKERTALAVTEEVSLIAEKGLTEKTYQKANEYFNKNEIVQLIVQICAINTWNRLAVSMHSVHTE